MPISAHVVFNCNKKVAFVNSFSQPYGLVRTSTDTTGKKKARFITEPRFEDVNQGWLVAITPTATAKITPTAATAWTLFAGPGNIHGQSSTVQFLAVQGIDGLLRLFR